MTDKKLHDLRDMALKQLEDSDRDFKARIKSRVEKHEAATKLVRDRLTGSGTAEEIAASLALGALMSW